MKQEAAHLQPVRLVDMPAAVVVQMGDMAEATRTRALLASEAEAIEAARGKNAYSDYLLAHHRRPGPDEAAAIGRLLGARVEADDGTLQPPLTPVDKLHLRQVKGRRRDASRRYDQLIRLRTAISALAQNRDDPAELINRGSFLLEDPEIANQLDGALQWLTRFAEEWHRREKTTCAGDAEPTRCT